MAVPAGTYAFETGVVLLLLGLGYAAVQDWRTREVGDGIWQLMGVAGALLGFVPTVPLGLLPTALWGLMSFLVLEHLFAWDLRLERVSRKLPGVLEVIIYGATASVAGVVGYRYGIGPSGLPLPVVAVLASVLLMRGLFEAGVLYGGADAKALMVTAILVPIDASPIWSPPAAAGLLAYYPFAVTALIDAAVFAVVVPIALALRNAGRHEFEFPRGFLGFRIPVDELPRRFVWLRDPTLRAGDPANEDVETSEEDRQLRDRQAQELRAQGVSRVWVTPQLPFIVGILAGVVGALVLGNLVFDLASLL